MCERQDSKASSSPEWETQGNAEARNSELGTEGLGEQGCERHAHYSVSEEGLQSGVEMAPTGSLPNISGDPTSLSAVVWLLDVTQSSVR